MVERGDFCGHVDAQTTARAVKASKPGHLRTTRADIFPKVLTIRSTRENDTHTGHCNRLAQYFFHIPLLSRDGNQKQERKSTQFLDRNEFKANLSNAVGAKYEIGLAHKSCVRDITPLD